MSTNLSWRLAFWIGAVIAVIGYVARSRLRETTEFANYKTRLSKKVKLPEESKKNLNIMEWFKSFNGKNTIAFFFTEFHLPICFYVTYIYLGDFIKTLGYTSQQVINHNLKVAIFEALGVLLVAYLVKKIHPIKIAIFFIFLFCATLPFIPYVLNWTLNLPYILCLQCLIMCFGFSTAGTLDPIQYKYFPIEKRFTYIATTFGIANPLSKLIVAFSLIPLCDYFGHYALWIVFIPALIGYWWAINYFKKLEIKRGAYHNYPHEDFPHDDTAGKEEDYDYEDLGDEYEPFSHRCMYSTKLMNKLDEFSKEKNVKLNMKLIEKAVTFAKKWHDGQMRKTGDHPFYFHPLKVAEMVAERYCKTDVIVAAILHDTVEDSECTVGLIEEKFNARIAQIVDRLTNKRFENGKHIKLSFEETINRLQKLGDDEALFIKQMDRQHNLETIKGLSPHKQQKMAHETHNYFIKLIAIIGDRLNIHGKMRLENKMFKSCHDILKKKKNDF
jgi:hypothetical protein